MSESPGTFKAILVGDRAVGKTSILKKYIDGYFPEKYKATWGVNLLGKDYSNGRGENFTIIYWDITGSDLFQDQRSYYYEGAEAIILVYDVTQPATFSNLKKWHSEIMITKELKKKPIYIFGNKADLEQNVSKKEIDKFSFNIEAKHFFVSAKTNQNLDKAFIKIVEAL